MQLLDLESTNKLLQSNRQKRIMLTFHSVADTDSISSAVALSMYLEHARIAAPDIITSNAKRLLKQLGFDTQISSDFYEGAEMVVMLDVNNFEGCGRFEEKLREFTGDILIIDHHLKQPLQPAGSAYAFDSESYNSTASMVYALLKSSDFNTTKQLAKLLATGIISDSAEFKNAGSLTFVQIGELLSIAGVDYPTLMEEVQSTPAPELRKEALEDIVRASISIRNGLVYVRGYARSSANIRADYAIKSGADIALFYSETADELSFSVRMRPPLDSQLKLHMGSIMKELAGVIQGTGGGHPCAAGAYGKLKRQRDAFIAGFEGRVFGPQQ